LARGWRQRAIAFAAGTFSTLAFAPFFLWPVLLATFPILVWLIEGAQPDGRPARASAHAAWWFAFGYFFSGLWWIGEAFLVEAEVFAWLLPFAITLLPAGMALFWALAALIAQRFWPKDDSVHPQTVAVCRVLVLASALGVTEWLRGHIFTGFPWNVPGLALTYPLALMQSASIFGIYGLTLWAVFLLAVPAVLQATSAPSRKRTALALSGAPLLLAYALGSWHLAAAPSPALPPA
jgi:apolipoprotein N-acyltransferase